MAEIAQASHLGRPGTYCVFSRVCHSRSPGICSGVKSTTRPGIPRVDKPRMANNGAECAAKCPQGAACNGSVPMPPHEVMAPGRSNLRHWVRTDQPKRSLKNLAISVP
jgi:hypothetical protein